MRAKTPCVCDQPSSRSVQFNQPSKLHNVATEDVHRCAILLETCHCSIDSMTTTCWRYICQNHHQRPPHEDLLSRVFPRGNIRMNDDPRAEKDSRKTACKNIPSRSTAIDVVAGLRVGHLADTEGDNIIQSHSTSSTQRKAHKLGFGLKRALRSSHTQAGLPTLYRE